MSFLRFKDNRIINLKNVTNIAILKEKNRFIFNMNYGITLPNENKIISDYVYWDMLNEKEFSECMNMISSYVQDWIFFPKNPTRIINKDCVSSIVFDYESTPYNANFRRMKIIFNFCNSVSFKQGGLTSDFTYFSFNNEQDYEQCKKYILENYC